ncbi:hypothetical protein [Streptomyces pratensis]|uniref:hypothetical protein n=1 Tax=Streptomyces pratensis TaxID=1169025 RepID=UPI00301A5499
MSRTPWCCLTALLAVVVGLLCGPAAQRGGAAVPPAATAPHTSVASAVSGADAAADTAPAGVPVLEAVEAAGGGVPGCGKQRDHDGEPAVPSRVRAAYDQAPGLAPWGLPAATGALPAQPPQGLRIRLPVPAAPTPVELSVLRV